jgi:uncharacterized membrane protein YhiD involved in acid resistance
VIISDQFLKVIEIFIKLLITALCAGTLMFYRDKTIRFPFSKIVMMVSLGFCLIIILWEINFGDAVGLSLIFFASMIVVSGIISSAIIIAHHGSSEGLTIAAMILLYAGIGMSVGYSLYFAAITATVIGNLFLMFMDTKSDKI